jgi:hypothetical protein
MKISTAIEMANLLRILYKLKTLDFVSVDRAIDEIQVWVLEYELDPLALKQRDPLLPWRDLADESDLDLAQ